MMCPSNPMLTPQQRVRVAEAVLKKPCRLVSDYIAACTPRPDQYHYRWAPDFKIAQKDALITKAAKLIDKLQVDPVSFSYKRKLDYKDRFIKALSTGDTNALEHLAYELITGEKA